MEIVRTILAIVATLVTTLVPSIIALVNAIKEKKTAQSVADSEHAQNAIYTEIKRLVENAEIAFAEIDKLMKANNIGTAGSMKKHNVVMELKAFCLEHGYAWDDAKMDAAIENEIAFSKTVNAKTNAS